MKSLNDVFLLALSAFCRCIIVSGVFYKVSFHTQGLGVFKQMGGKIDSF